MSRHINALGAVALNGIVFDLSGGAQLHPNAAHAIAADGVVLDCYQRIWITREDAPFFIGCNAVALDKHEAGALHTHPLGAVVGDLITLQQPA